MDTEVARRTIVMAVYCMDQTPKVEGLKAGPDYRLDRSSEPPLFPDERDNPAPL
jgi:hypothetical protein